MGDYIRSTRECSIGQVRPELRRALEEYFQKNGLGDIEVETILCCETVSEKKAAGWLDTLLGGKAEPVVYTAMLLTPAHLIWARSGQQSTINVNIADLRFIHVKPYSSLFIKDTGLEISGLLGDSKGMKLGYIGMGPEPITQKFCDKVQQAIDKVHPPPASKWPAWMRSDK